MPNELLLLKEKLSSCNLCQLSETRTQTVFGTGTENAKVMLVGEAPGKNEDEQGVPFVGRGGKLLDSMLETVGLFRNKNIYIANMVKCRPPENRDPTPAETTACLPFLQQQIDIIKPSVIVCVGRVAAQRLISPKFKVTVEHGMFFNQNGTIIMGTLHPAAILRNPKQKVVALEDWQKLRAFLEKDYPEVLK